jgi:hypothetical protein
LDGEFCLKALVRATGEGASWQRPVARRGATKWRAHDRRGHAEWPVGRWAMATGERGQAVETRPGAGIATGARGGAGYRQ